MAMRLRENRNDSRTATAATSSIAVAPIREAATGHRPWPGGTCANNTKNAANASPEKTVSTRRRRVRRRCRADEPSRLSMETNTVATSASAMPAPAAGAGRSPAARPNASGTAAARTAVIGEITLIGPRESAR